MKEKKLTLPLVGRRCALPTDSHKLPPGPSRSKHPRCLRQSWTEGLCLAVCGRGVIHKFLRDLIVGEYQFIQARLRVFHQIAKATDGGRFQTAHAKGFEVNDCMGGSG